MVNNDLSEEVDTTISDQTDYTEPNSLPNGPLSPISETSSAATCKTDTQESIRPTTLQEPTKSADEVTPQSITTETDAKHIEGDEVSTDDEDDEDDEASLPATSVAGTETTVDEEVESYRLMPTSLYCSVPLTKDVQSIIDTFSKTDDRGGKKSRKLLCLYCDRTFVAANLRQKHVDRCHSVKQARRSSSRIQQSQATTSCLFCDKYTKTDHSLSELFQHQISEHSDKYFGCLTCEERFLTQTGLDEHNVDQHDIKPELEDVKNVQSEVEDVSDLVSDGAIDSSVVKIRHKSKIKSDVVVEAAEEVVIKPRRTRQQVRELRSKRISIKSTKLGIKRSARLQHTNQKLTKNGRKKQQIKEKLQIIETKIDKDVKVSTDENPYPTFDAFYRVKKITDHSIDNLRISSLTFNDVFDQAFYSRIKCNIRENLLNHLDGKLFKNEESESRISTFEKTTTETSAPENYGCELTLNAATPIPSSSLLSTQFGDDLESQIEYGSKASKKKPVIKKDEVHYKYFTRRKYQASILEGKENRDLSKLDMWTQFVIKNRQQKVINISKSDKEKLDYKKGDEYKGKKQNEELNRILDRRGPFEDLKEEANKKAALEGNFNQEANADVSSILEDILGNVFSNFIDESKTDLTDSDMPEHLNLRKASINNESVIDKSDKITLICASQETENFEAPQTAPRDKNALVELTGEWARSRLYICAACGLKFGNLKILLDHKNIVHQNVWCQHYEFVGNQGRFYKHLSIPGLGKVSLVEENPIVKMWRRSDARGCSKCKKQCNSLGELHRHVLECGEDWSWMMVRKKCKYRPFGAKTRKKRRGLFKHVINTNKNKPKGDKPKYNTKARIEGPRPKPSDAETIQRMLANLPAKRATRKIMSLKDGFPPKHMINSSHESKSITQIKTNSNKNKNLRLRRSRAELLILEGEKLLSARRKVINARTGVKCNPVTKLRQSVRNLNKVISSKLIDTANSILVKRKLKNVLQQQRFTRRTRQLAEEKKSTDEEIVDGVVMEEISNETKEEIVSVKNEEKLTLLKKVQNLRKSFSKKKNKQTPIVEDKLNEDINVKKVKIVETITEVSEEDINNGISDLKLPFVKLDPIPPIEVIPIRKTKKTTKEIDFGAIKPHAKSEDNVLLPLRKTRSGTNLDSNEKEEFLVNAKGESSNQSTASLPEVNSPAKKKVCKKSTFGSKIMRSLSLRRKKVGPEAAKDLDKPVNLLLPEGTAKESLKPSEEMLPQIVPLQEEHKIPAKNDSENTKNNGKRKSKFGSLKNAVKRIRLTKKPSASEEYRTQHTSKSFIKIIGGHFLEEGSKENNTQTINEPQISDKLDSDNEPKHNSDNNLVVQKTNSINNSTDIVNSKIDYISADSVENKTEVDEEVTNLIVNSETNEDLRENSQETLKSMPEKVNSVMIHNSEALMYAEDLSQNNEALDLSMIKSDNSQSNNRVDLSVKSDNDLTKSHNEITFKPNKLCKRTKGLNACIAMLTSKLIQKPDDVQTDNDLALVSNNESLITNCIPIICVNKSEEIQKPEDTKPKELNDFLLPQDLKIIQSPKNQIEEMPKTKFDDTMEPAEGTEANKTQEFVMENASENSSINTILEIVDRGRESLLLEQKSLKALIDGTNIAEATNLENVIINLEEDIIETVKSIANIRATGKRKQKQKIGSMRRRTPRTKNTVFAPQIHSTNSTKAIQVSEIKDLLNEAILKDDVPEIVADHPLLGKQLENSSSQHKLETNLPKDRSNLDNILDFVVSNHISEVCIKDNTDFGDKTKAVIDDNSKIEPLDTKISKATRKIGKTRKLPKRKSKIHLDLSPDIAELPAEAILEGDLEIIDKKINTDNINNETKAIVSKELSLILEESSFNKTETLPNFVTIQQSPIKLKPNRKKNENIHVRNKLIDDTITSVIQDYNDLKTNQLSAEINNLEAVFDSVIKSIVPEIETVLEPAIEIGLKSIKFIKENFIESLKNNKVMLETNLDPIINVTPKGKRGRPKKSILSPPKLILGVASPTKVVRPRRNMVVPEDTISPKEIPENFNVQADVVGGIKDNLKGQSLEMAKMDHVNECIETCVSFTEPSNSNVIQNHETNPILPEKKVVEEQHSIVESNVTTNVESTISKEEATIDDVDKTCTEEILSVSKDKIESELKIDAEILVETITNGIQCDKEDLREELDHINAETSFVNIPVHGSEENTKSGEIELESNVLKITPKKVSPKKSRKSKKKDIFVYTDETQEQKELFTRRPKRGARINYADYTYPFMKDEIEAEISKTEQSLETVTQIEELKSDEVKVVESSEIKATNMINRIVEEIRLEEKIRLENEIKSKQIEDIVSISELTVKSSPRKSKKGSKKIKVLENVIVGQKDLIVTKKRKSKSSAEKVYNQDTLENAYLECFDSILEHKELPKLGKESSTTIYTEIEKLQDNIITPEDPVNIDEILDKIDVIFESEDFSEIPKEELNTSTEVLENNIIPDDSLVLNKIDVILDNEIVPITKEKEITSKANIIDIKEVGDLLESSNILEHKDILSVPKKGRKPPRAKYSDVNKRKEMPENNLIPTNLLNTDIILEHKEILPIAKKGKRAARINYAESAFTEKKMRSSNNLAPTNEPKELPISKKGRKGPRINVEIKETNIIPTDTLSDSIKAQPIIDHIEAPTDEPKELPISKKGRKGPKIHAGIKETNILPTDTLSDSINTQPIIENIEAVLENSDALQQAENILQNHTILEQKDLLPTPKKDVQNKKDSIESTELLEIQQESNVAPSSLEDSTVVLQEPKETPQKVKRASRINYSEKELDETQKSSISQTIESVIQNPHKEKRVFGIKYDESGTKVVLEYGKKSTEAKINVFRGNIEIEPEVCEVVERKRDVVDIIDIKYGSMNKILVADKPKGSSKTDYLEAPLEEVVSDKLNDFVALSKITVSSKFNLSAETKSDSGTYRESAENLRSKFNLFPTTEEPVLATKKIKSKLKSKLVQKKLKQASNVVSEIDLKKGKHRKVKTSRKEMPDSNCSVSDVNAEAESKIKENIPENIKSNMEFENEPDILENKSFANDSIALLLNNLIADTNLENEALQLNAESDSDDEVPLAAFKKTSAETVKEKIEFFENAITQNHKDIDATKLLNSESKIFDAFEFSDPIIENLEVIPRTMFKRGKAKKKCEINEDSVHHNDVDLSVANKIQNIEKSLAIYDFNESTEDKEEINTEISDNSKENMEERRSPKRFMKKRGRKPKLSLNISSSDFDVSQTDSQQIAEPETFLTPLKDTKINEIQNDSFIKTPDLSDTIISQKLNTHFKIKQGNKNKKVKGAKKADEIDNVDTYCEICRKQFVRIENLIKHKRTLTHIAKLSEIEAIEAAEKSKIESKQEKIVDDTIFEDVSKRLDEVIEDINDDINDDCMLIDDDIQDCNAQDGDLQNGDDFNDDRDFADGMLITSPFNLKTNNDTLKLAEIINDVLSKPAEKNLESFSDILEQKQETKRYKSLGERKSFDSDTIMYNSSKSTTCTNHIDRNDLFSNKTTADSILEKQISLLENIIEADKANFHYIDEMSVSSNKSEQRCPSDMSLVSDIKQDDSNIITFSHNSNLVNSLIHPKTNFVKPNQYEEISEDSLNVRNYEDQRSRKTLNRDEALFIECCSLLKSSSEISNFSKKSTRNVANNFEMKANEGSEWLERKNYNPKQKIFTRNEEFLSDNSCPNTPIGDNFDDFSNSDTIKTDWNTKMKEQQFEDISIDSISNHSQAQSNFNNFNHNFNEDKSNSDVESSKISDGHLEFNDDSNTSEFKKKIDAKFVGLMAEALKTQDSDEKIVKNSKKRKIHSEITQTSITDYAIPISKKVDNYSDSQTNDSKKMLTKGAMKVFEGLKVSIPTEDLDMNQVLNCSPTSKRLEIENEIKEDKISKPKEITKKSNIRKFGNKLGLKITKKKNKIKKASPNKNKKMNLEAKNKVLDIYDFEETQDNSDLFVNSNLRTFRSDKIINDKDDSNDLNNDNFDDLVSSSSKQEIVDIESDSEIHNPLIDSCNFEARSLSSFSTETESSTSLKKASSIKNTTKKKCVIMGRIFKNAFKSKMEEKLIETPDDVDEGGVKLAEDAPKAVDVKESVRSKMSTKEMDMLFDQLLKENKALNPPKKIVEQVIIEEPFIPPVEVEKPIESKLKLMVKPKKRQRKQSQSSDDEFNITKTPKKRVVRKKAKEKDNEINLEQELKECIGVAGRKTQRKCTSGKQNVLVEYWSSDDSEFEAFLNETLPPIKVNQNPPVIVNKPEIPLEMVIDDIEETVDVPPPYGGISSSFLHEIAKDVTEAKIKAARKLQKSSHSNPNKNKTKYAGADALAGGNRKKRTAADKLYYWSSSSDDESGNLIEIKPVRDDNEDDDDRPMQHGWIVGDSPKKLVTMLAIAKGKKTDLKSVKEQGKKRTTI